LFRPLRQRFGVRVPGGAPPSAQPRPGLPPGPLRFLACRGPRWGRDGPRLGRRPLDHRPARNDLEALGVHGVKAGPAGRRGTVVLAAPRRQARRKKEASYGLDHHSLADPWRLRRGLSQDRGTHVARQAGRGAARPTMEGHGRRIAFQAPDHWGLPNRQHSRPRPDRNVRSGFGVLEGGASVTGKKLRHRLLGLDGGG
jgi:hypothetical protein